MTQPPLQVLIEPYLGAIEAHFWIEGLVALIAALFAIALRRQRRLFKAPGFIMIALGLIVDMMTPQTRAWEIWVHAGRALALLLVAFGLIRLAVEAFLILRRRRKDDPSTIISEIILTGLYGTTALAVLRFMLGIDPRVLLAVPALGTLIVGWIRQANFFSGLLIQYHRPFVQGDWVRLGDHLGRVVGTGWRATWMITRNNEHVQIPNAALAAQAVVNYSSGDAMVADELFIEIDRDVAPSRVEQIVAEVLRSMSEIMTSETDLWEYKGAVNRYRIRFWLADYAADERVRTSITRSLWYALRRNAIEVGGGESQRIPAESNGHRELSHHDDPAHSREILAELRRVYLLNALSDEELALVASAIRPLQFGKGEALVHEGDEGDRFYILRKGRVEVFAHGQEGAREKHIRDIADTSRENFFGEIALLTGDKRNATVRATTDVDVWEVGRDAFARLFRARPEAGTTIAEVAGRRSAETSAATHVGDEAATHAEALRRSAMLLLAMRKMFDF